jgi:hypothetical protein
MTVEMILIVQYCEHTLRISYTYKLIRFLEFVHNATSYIYGLDWIIWIVRWTKSSSLLRSELKVLISTELTCEILGASELKD